jgi:hypothetical protein
MRTESNVTRSIAEIRGESGGASYRARKPKHSDHRTLRDANGAIPGRASRRAEFSAGDVGACALRQRRTRC